MAKYIPVPARSAIVVLCAVLTISQIRWGVNALDGYVEKVADSKEVAVERRVLTDAASARVDTKIYLFVDEADSVVPSTKTGKPYERGSVSVWRSRITSGPDSSSDHVGDVEGMTAYTGGNKHLVTSVMHIKTTEYEGSISLIGATSEDWTDKRQYAVAGGTGSFLFVRGKATFIQAEPGEQIAKVELCLRFDD